MNFYRPEVAFFDSIDLAQFIELDQKYMPFAWTKEMWQGLIGRSDHMLISVTNGPALLGFALFHLVDQTADLYKVVVDEAFRGKGIAQEIVNFGHGQLKQKGATLVLLEVQASNSSAIKLYKKLGYHYDRAVRCYYSNGDDALIFSYALDKT